MNDGAERWIVGLVVAFALASLVGFGLLLGFGDDLEVVESWAADSYSKSAVGHDAFVSLLDEAGYSVRRSRYQTGSWGSRASLLVLLEPQLDSGEDAEEIIAQADNILLVLPKRWSQPDYGHDGWIQTTGLVETHRVDEFLRDAGLLRTAGVDRKPLPDGERPLSCSGEPWAPIAKTPLQTYISGVGDDTMLECEGEAVVVRLTNPGRTTGTVVIVTEPDPFQTHGLALEANRDFVLDLVATIARPGGTVVVDETLHGHELPPSLLREMKRYPLVLISTQLFLLILLVLWSTIGRFGSPAPAPRTRQQGIDPFIENSADLMHYAGHHALMAERYVWQVLNRVGERLHAPHGLERAALVEWLEKVTSQRNNATNLREIVADAEDYATGVKRGHPRAMLALAARIRRWEREILNDT